MTLSRSTGMRHAIVSALVPLLLMLGCAGPSVESTVSPTAAPTAEPSASPPPSPSSDRTPAATPDEAILAVGGFAEVVTTDLVVRSAPGTAADSEIYGAIEHVPAYIIAGPVQADGFDWWLVAHPHMERLGGPPAGWVAASGKDGEVWLAPTQPECPEAPSGEDEWLQPSMWVSCYTGMELTLGGALGGCAASLSPAWDHACSLYPCAADAAAASCLEVFDAQSVTLHFNSMPAQLQGRITVVGHFDDPRASACAAVGGWRAPLAAFECRLHFVVTSYQFTD